MKAEALCAAGIEPVVVDVFDEPSLLRAVSAWIAVDGSGNLYIADSQNLRVRKISGSNISTIAAAIARLPVTAKLASTNAPVSYGGTPPNMIAGVYRVNVQVPTGLAAGAVSIVLQASGASTPSGVTIQVQ
jgi:uncharacterized protein (TIGR03437 family)